MLLIYNGRGDDPTRIYFPVVIIITTIIVFVVNVIITTIINCCRAFGFFFLQSF